MRGGSGKYGGGLDAGVKGKSGRLLGWGLECPSVDLYICVYTRTTERGMDPRRRR